MCDDQPYLIELRHYAPRQTRHHHRHAQVVIPLQGSMDLAIASHETRLAAGMVAVLAPGARHDFSGSARNRFLVFDLHDPVLIGICLQPDMAPLRALGVTASGYLALLAGELERGGQRLCSRAAITTACELLTEPAPTSSAIEQTSRLRRGERLLAESGADGAGVAEIAATIGLSVSQFNRLYRARHGCSPKQAQIAARLARASRLLRETEASVSTIAYLLGYRNPSSFCALFKQHLGMTPSDYRRTSGHG
ncbi:helix-turn-helix transcriptional regulator [Marichromatium bheemlicum]|uniref:AraC family transcriptional regulator n=1 Tax=Marichromatium bheemlicum TaxID=365339 RepID=A0ABX1I8C9_9GAMM|nr:AraC family transcriptional regulator [Marichromatium bheemlicum]NKN32487.1 AraC family transcriptional regulator [Marichromatium bheemlicum]